MLSLVVVLSVYYITSPEQQQNELAAVDEEQEQMTNKLKNRIKNKSRAGYGTNTRGRESEKIQH